MNIGWSCELTEFVKAKAHHLPIEDQHALAVMLAAAPKETARLQEENAQLDGMWVEKAEQAIARYAQDYAELAKRIPVVKMIRDRGIAYEKLPPNLQKDLDKQMKVVRWLSVPIFEGEATK